MASRRLYSESDLSAGKLVQRESITDYIASRRGSLSDLVFSNRKLSRESVFAQNQKRSRHLSLVGQASLVSSQKQRSSSLVPTLQKLLSRDIRSDYTASGISNFEKRIAKTRSLNNLNAALPKFDDQKRGSKDQISINKRRRTLRRIKSLQAFESVIKSRKRRQRFDVSSFLIPDVANTGWFNVYKTGLIILIELSFLKLLFL